MQLSVWMAVPLYSDSDAGLFDHRMRRGCCEPAHTGSGENTNVPVFSRATTSTGKSSRESGTQTLSGMQASVFISFKFHLQADKYKRVKSSESGTL